MLEFGTPVSSQCSGFASCNPVSGKLVGRAHTKRIRSNVAHRIDARSCLGNCQTGRYANPIATLRPRFTCKQRVFEAAGPRDLRKAWVARGVPAPTPERFPRVLWAIGS